MYFNVNFNVFKNNVHLLVSELYMYYVGFTVLW